MKKLLQSSVLISGLGGLGVEIAKNVILAGAQRVTVHDRLPARVSDLASNFYLTESSVGQNRADACLPQLKSLNEYVTVASATGDLTRDLISQFKCVVLADEVPQSEIDRVGSTCRELNIAFIISQSRGVFGYVFNDFGDNFVVAEPGTTDPVRFFIQDISRERRGLVMVSGGEAHGLGDGEIVEFVDVEGMTEINGRRCQVTVESGTHFSIDLDTTSFHEFDLGSRMAACRQIYLPLPVKFKPLKEALRSPIDFDARVEQLDWGRDEQIVLAFQAAALFKDRFPGAPETGGALIDLVREINDEVKFVDSINEDLIREFSREAGAVISPSCAALGGIVGQEVLKALSSKFVPLVQLLAFAFLESLPTGSIRYDPVGDRYDPYRQVFGNDLVDKFRRLRYFMVGAGALGCELLKNWALMGIATLDDGRVFLTDMDQIERSNLNRQFLFRNDDIGKMKSVAAAAAVATMNPAMRIEAHTNRLSPETLGIYNDTFYQGLDGVCNALDNVEARVFSDERCIFYGLPLLESGTLGPKGNFQAFIPHLTENYGARPAPAGAGIPMCTLHHFPSNIEHTTMWARDVFVGLFDQAPRATSMVLEDREYISKNRDTDAKALAEKLETVKEVLVTERCDTFEDCVKWARRKFDEFFNWRIRDLRTKFPEDQRTPLGVPFWLPPRRFPRIVDYDPANEWHVLFVTATAILRARTCGIVATGDAAQLAATFRFDYVPDTASIPDDPNAEPDDLTRPAADLDRLIAELKAVLVTDRKFVPEEFEKDNDANSHVDFVAAAANIRATNYLLEPQDKFTIKKIAGHIIPAIATTTAMVCGFVGLEMYKVHATEKKPITAFRAGSANVAASVFTFTVPRRPETHVCPLNGQKFTVWDYWRIDGDLTLQELIQQLNEKYQVEPEQLMAQGAILKSYASDEATLAARMQKKISDTLVTEMGKKPLGPGQNTIEIVVLQSDSEGNDLPIPKVLLKVR